MRWLPILLLAAAPGLAASQTVPAAGQVVFSPNATIGQAECASTTDTVGITWQVKPDSTFTTGGTYSVYVSNQDRGSTSPYCYTDADNGAGTVVAKVLVSSIDASSATVTSAVALKTADLASVTAQVGCASGSFPAYVCVQWRDASSSVTGYAKGTVTLQLNGPAKPSVTAVTPGDGALNVTVAAGTGSTVAAVQYQAKAVAVDPAADGTTHYSPKSGSTRVRVAGLTNGVPYTVTALAFSSEGNASPESDAWGTAVAPVHVADGWEYYQLKGGRDDGGCAAGGAGALALLAAAALLRLRRRP
jgi:hypothetical protein